MPATLFEIDLAGRHRRSPAQRPLQVVSATQSANFGQFAIQRFRPCVGLEEHQTNGQLRRNRQKLRDEPHALKVCQDRESATHRRKLPESIPPW